MQISVMGLGYVGAVTAACLARRGHRLIGVDKQSLKVDIINLGRAPVVEPGLEEIISDSVKSGALRATSCVEEAVLESDLTFVCVGTPSRPNGGLDMTQVQQVSEEIGRALRRKNDFHVIIMRSTVLPGALRQNVIPALEDASAKKIGKDFGVCHNPEFLREGTAVYDFFNPPKIVVGEGDLKSGALLAGLFKDLDAPLVRTSIEVAEMVKYADNAWHALKIGFANEIGNVCKALGIDSHEVMNVFCKDTKLNLSPAYLRPGFAFGGSCLPKDVRALTQKARELDIEAPILNAILPSNHLQVENTIRMIAAKPGKRVGVLGFSFKAETDDLRESPVVEVIERLIGKGYDVRVYDRSVNLARLGGANRDYILNHIPHISKLMEDSVEKVIQHAETIVIGNEAHEFKAACNGLFEGKEIVDLVRIADYRSKPERYEGICW